MERLIANIEQDTINTASVTGVKQIDKRVLAAIKSIDRRHFVLPKDSSFAYDDLPLHIGYGQTISQPFIVALMIHLIEPKSTDKVLEVGSGSGFVVAVLSQLCAQVFGIEIIADLVERSKAALANEKITNATIICSDGNIGLLEHAPFDKIIVSAGANKLPDLLLDQLAVGGILVLPNNFGPFDQMLVRIEKISPTEYKMKDILPVRFVPLVNS